MKRTMAGLISGLAIWLGSALAAEAQQITPTGPMCVTAGQASATYTATINLPIPANFLVKLKVYRGTELLGSYTTIVSNPLTNIYSFSKSMDTSAWNLQVGDSLRYSATLTVLSVNFAATDWSVVVTGTRPSSKITAANKTRTLALAGVDKDRRKE